jgi:hypothetical protein
MLTRYILFYAEKEKEIKNKKQGKFNTKNIIKDPKLPKVQEARVFMTLNFTKKMEMILLSRPNNKKLRCLKKKI